jgi:preprotein translocase subunit YajC
MRTLLLTLMNLMLVGTAFAQDAGAPPSPSMPMPWPVMVAFVLIFYFLLWRPQQKMRKQHQTMVDSLKRGDVVITAAGIRGTITRVDDNNRTMSVEIAPGVEVTVVKSTITELEVRKGEQLKPANDVEPGDRQKK